jgi:hypothetical protein
MHRNILYFSESKKASNKEKEDDKPTSSSIAPDIIEKFKGVASKDIVESTKEEKKKEDS